MNDRRWNGVIGLVWFVIFALLIGTLTTCQVIVGRKLGHPNDPTKWTKPENQGTIQ